jgi:restriction system protein
MQKGTIRSAIIKILSESNKSLSPMEVYNKIMEQKLFEFKAKNPVAIVNSVIRKNCLGVNLKKSNSEKQFEMKENGRYILKKN